MATLVFTAIGTALGGPFGGAIGSFIGSQFDKAVFGSGAREGPRLKELAVTTSSYGTPVARHYGTMRTAGSIIWATDLVESKEKSGGKGKPSVTTYSYSVSFAVALSSRPINRLGRIWADGNLLRGAAGDLKSGGKLRIYRGHGDQKADPLMASAQGGKCPAFRGMAYCVFEDLQLAEFGNRIPALTFEIVADDGEVSLANLVEPLAGKVSADAGLVGLGGFSDEGGSLAASLDAISQVYPLSCIASGETLKIEAESPSVVATLPAAAIDAGEEGFGGAAGQARRRIAEGREVPDCLRYYDIDRDFQAGMQRADGRARPGRGRVMEFPGALRADTARNLANSAAERAGWSRDTLSWRTAEVDPAFVPGSVVRVPGKAGTWRIETWEWRESGVELELRRLPPGAARQTPADAGEALRAPDVANGPTTLVAFELPWDGGSSDIRRITVAATSSSPGWKGAALYLERGEELVPAGSTGGSRSTIGNTLTPLPRSRSLHLERYVTLDIELVASDMHLTGATAEQLASGANRALVGTEILQFATATHLHGASWRIGVLLRGRGGTEGPASYGVDAGASFVLLDDTLRTIEPGQFGVPQAMGVTAIGLADTQPVSVTILNPRQGQRPLAPVHAKASRSPDGALALRWTRRARGAWDWPDGVETPLNEQVEAYLVGIGDTNIPPIAWKTDRPLLDLSPETVAQLEAEHSGAAIWVRQTGNFAASEPAFLTTIE